MTKKRKPKCVVRCKKCWKDVALICEGEKVPNCPICKAIKTTYVHATLPKAPKDVDSPMFNFYGPANSSQK